jgi:hypothetical protein
MRRGSTCMISQRSNSLYGGSENRNWHAVLSRSWIPLSLAHPSIRIYTLLLTHDTGFWWETSVKGTTWKTQA